MTEGDGTVVTLTLSGPALGLRDAHRLDVALAELTEDGGARALVLVGGADFCTGPAGDLDPARCGFDLAARVAAVPCPVIASLQGRVSSIGLEIALAADLRVAAPDARFALADVAAGRLPSWGGTQRLPRVVGPGTAAAMLLLGTELDAAAALATGLVTEIADDPDTRAGAVAGELGALAPLALAMAKEAVREGLELPLRAALRMEGDFNHLLMTTDDRAEGLQAFVEKRPPDFTGR